jgi:multidrug efflux pump subunit AcrA (membrane-fusion protein)
MLNVIHHHKWTSGLLLAVAATGGLLVWSSLNAAQPESAGHATSRPKSGSSGARKTAANIRVLTISPSTQGTVRQTSLPCSAHWHDYASLYAKVSGYLGDLQVDIGSRVKQGQVLAKIDVPELDQDVAVAEATLGHSLAAVQQTEARKKSAIAEQRAAEAAIVKAQSDVERWTAESTFREKEYHRFQDLNRSDSVHQALVDEKLFQLQSVQAGQRAAESAVLTAREQASAAAARVELAEADLQVAKAQANIARTNLDKAL